MTFSATERRGAIVLFLFLIVITALRIIQLYIPTTPPGRYNSELKQLADSFITAQNERLYLPVEDNPIVDSVLSEPFYFNPNEAGIDELIELGLSPAVAQTLINYRLKGGRFSASTDLRKIYGLKEEVYQKLAPWVIIEETFNPDNNNKIGESHSTRLININTADTNQLKQLKGIGSVLSARIIKYRYLLGGFTDCEQIKEVYGISDTLYNSIARVICTEPFEITKINLTNTEEWKLAQHPYIGKYKAGAIISLRNYKNKEILPTDLTDNNIVSEKELERLLPYINNEQPEMNNNKP